MKSTESTLLASWASAELRRPVANRDQWMVEQSLKSVDGLIATIARRYSAGRDIRDAQQNARVELLIALPRYNKDKGAFSTFATFVIRKAIQQGYGLSGMATRTSHKQRGQSSTRSLDATVSGESTKSLYDVLADSNSGEEYIADKLDNANHTLLINKFGDTIKKDFHKELWTRYVVNGEVSKYQQNGDKTQKISVINLICLEHGKTKQAGYRALKVLQTKFEQFANRQG